MSATNRKQFLACQYLTVLQILMNVSQSPVRMEAHALMGMVLIPVNVPVDLMEQIVKQVCKPTLVVFVVLLYCIQLLLSY